MKPHVAEAVEAEMARRYPPGVRLLLDLVRAGRCGQSTGSERDAHVAQEIAEHNEDRASSEAFLDLAYALRNLSPEHESNELCAGALAEAWRRTYPFRRHAEGDALDVLLPHASDAGAVLSLDRARALSRPPVALARLVHEMTTALPGDDVPYSRALAQAMLAESEVELLNAVPQANYAMDEIRQTALKVVRHAFAWARETELKYYPKLDSTSAADLGEVEAEIGYAQSERERDELKRLFRALLVAQNATWYVRHYNKLVGPLRAREAAAENLRKWLKPDEIDERLVVHDREIAKVRALFPDFYSEAA